VGRTELFGRTSWDVHRVERGEHPPLRDLLGEAASPGAALVLAGARVPGILITLLHRRAAALLARTLLKRFYEKLGREVSRYLRLMRKPAVKMYCAGPSTSSTREPSEFFFNIWHSGSSCWVIHSEAPRSAPRGELLVRRQRSSCSSSRCRCRRLGRDVLTARPRRGLGSGGLVLLSARARTSDARSRPRELAGSSSSRLYGVTSTP